MPDEVKVDNAQRMDEDAVKAREEFINTIVLTAGSAKDVAAWVKKWYLAAGYKRLCKTLMEIAP